MLAIMVVLVMSLLAVFPAFASPSESGDNIQSPAQDADLPARNEDPAARVHDPANLLNESQEEQLNADIARLQSTGIESVVFVRDGADTATGSESFAEELRIGWEVESAPGADDGIVFVLTVAPDENTTGRIDYSIGANTLPKNTFTAEELDSIVTVDSENRVPLNDYVENISFAARRMTNTIYDQAGAITERQATNLHGELQRLQTLGVPAVLYIRSSLDETDRRSADDIRVDFGVESSRGAEDGLVYLLTVDPQDPESGTFEVSAGANTYPIRQLDAARMDQIIADDVLPNVEAGDEYLALAFAIRRTINMAEYSPPHPPALTSTQSSLQTPMNVVAALLIQVAVIGYLLVPVVRERRVALLPEARSLVEYGIVMAILAIIVGAAGIVTRNPVSALAGLGVFVWASCGIPVLYQIVSRRNATRDSSDIGITTQSQGGQDVAPAN
jgi:uncharacterized membrane protein YgcG